MTEPKVAVASGSYHHITLYSPDMHTLRFYQVTDLDIPQFDLDGLLRFNYVSEADGTLNRAVFDTSYLLGWSLSK